MTSSRAGFLALFMLLCALCGRAQLSTNSSDSRVLERANALKADGNFAGAIALLRPLAESDARGNPGRQVGGLYDSLGSVYQDAGDFENARRWYELAIRTTENDPEQRRELAAAVNNLGSLEENYFQLDVSRRLRMRALLLYRSLGDHEGMARVYTGLAVIGIAERDFRAARKAFAEATRESSAAGNVDEDDEASLFCVHGSLELKGGHSETAVELFTHAVDLWTQQNGKEDLNTTMGLLLRAQAYLNDDQGTAALSDVQHAESIIARSVGTGSGLFWHAKLIEAAALDRQGKMEEARELKTRARSELTAMARAQCANCTIPLEAMR